MKTKTSSARTLFTLGWAAYFCTYVGRRTYSACMGELIALGVLSKSAAGLVATAFFICYGLGQIVNAFFGDSFPPLKTLLTGLIGSGVPNLLMPLFSAPALDRPNRGAGGLGKQEEKSSPAPLLIFRRRAGWRTV